MHSAGVCYCVLGMSPVPADPREPNTQSGLRLGVPSAVIRRYDASTAHLVHCDTVYEARLASSEWIDDVEVFEGR